MLHCIDIISSLIRAFVRTISFCLWVVLFASMVRDARWAAAVLAMMIDAFPFWKSWQPTPMGGEGGAITPDAPCCGHASGDSALDLFGTKEVAASAVRSDKTKDM